MAGWGRRAVIKEGGNLSATTNATGTSYTAFADQLCSRLVISNNTGTAIVFRQDATGAEFPIPDGQMLAIGGLTNANQIQVRRSDHSNTQVAVLARWEA